MVCGAFETGFFNGSAETVFPILRVDCVRIASTTYDSGEGEGLLFYGSTIIPFVDRFPKDTILYRIMTTKPNEKLLYMERN